MNSYLFNGQKYGWGPGVATLNSDKAALLQKYAQGKCLDIGFGSGLYTQHLRSLGHQVQGVDNQALFVQAAAKKYPEIPFLLGDIHRLPFKKGEFQTTIAFDILEHVEDTVALKEIFRVSKRLIFSVPIKNQEILLHYGLSHSHYLDNTHLRVYSLKSLRKLFAPFSCKIIFLKPSLPLSLSGLLIERLSGQNKLLKVLLKIILKPFLPEPPLYSTIFGVLEKQSLS
jgi:SAM-dependent methyltransferase